MNNRNCSLVAAATLLMTCSAGAFAQQISGTVVDKKSNETLIGAVVSVEGCNAKAVTDAGYRLDLEAPTKEHPSMTSALRYYLENNK